MKKIFFYLCFAFALVACSKQEQGPNYKYIVGTPSETTIDKSYFEDYDLDASYLDLIPSLKVRVVSINYKSTDAFGQDIVASGIIAYPLLLTGLTGTFLAHHVTTTSNEYAPSVYGFALESILAFAGGVVISPDYIGYGASSASFHTYHHAQSSAQNSVDMYLAAKEYMDYKNVNYSSNLTVVGYSQGAHVSLAFQRMVERDYSSSLSIDKVYVGAGAYDLVSSFEYMATEDEYAEPLYHLWLIASMDYTEALDLEPTEIFTPTIAELYTKFLAQEISVQELEGSITSKKKDDIFLNDIFEHEALKAALEKNSLLDWVPQSPIYMFHSKDDEIVPYFNSQNAYDSFSSSGSSVTLESVEGKTHSGAIADFVYFIVSALGYEL